MTDKLATNKQTDLAKAGSDKSLMGVVSRESGLPMIPGVDKEFRFKYPRAGKIRLGAPKPEGNRGPGEELAYFRLDPILLADKGFMDVLKKCNEDPTKPTRIPIWLPFPTIAANLSRSCDSWNTAGVLKCRSYDGVTCTKLDDKTGEYVTCACAGDACQAKQKNYCHWVHRLIVILPDAKGAGVWQIDSPSPNNWATLLTEMAALLGQTRGHISGIDLLLTREARPFQYTEKDFKTGAVKLGQDGKAKISTKDHYMLHIQHDMTPRQLLNVADAAQVIDSSDVEGFDLGFDAEDIPEEVFDVGEQVDEQTGEVLTLKPDATPTQEEMNTQELRSLCADIARDLSMTEMQYKNVIKTTFKRTVEAKDLNKDELLTLYAVLQKRMAE